MSDKKQATCRACGSPFVHIKDTNVLVCSNPNCDGKIWKTDDKGNKSFVKHINSYFLMDNEDKKGKRKVKRI